MLTQYIAKAMDKARYERLSDGSWYGEIALCRGVWATGETKEECARTLQEVLEGWLILKLRDNDPDIPVIDGKTIDDLKLLRNILRQAGISDQEWGAA